MFSSSDEIDEKMSRFGDVKISRYFSGDNHIVLAAHMRVLDILQEEVEKLMSEYGYSLYGSGVAGNYVIMTFNKR